MSLNGATVLSIAHASSPQRADTGDFVYRVLQPDAAMGALPGVQTVSFTTVCTHRDRLMREADALVLQMIGDPDLLPVIRERTRARRLTIFEVSDNFLAFQPGNPAAGFYADPANRACIMQLASLCHAVQFTMPELERRFAFLNPRRAVFMNQISALGGAARPERDTVTMGWGGSLGHYDDIRAMAPYLIAFLKSNPCARLAIMADRKITDLFKDAPRARKSYTRPGSLDDYYAFLDTLDIGLAPMIATDDFNACRSDVKFVEYAARGVVPVCGSAPPYAHTVRHGRTGFLFGNFDEMRGILETLCADPQLLRRVRHDAFQFVSAERTATADALRREEFYRQIIRELDLCSGSELHALDQIPAATKSPHGNHWSVGFGPVEQLLHDGLAAQFLNKDPKTAAALFDRACNLAPGFYPARLYSANLLAETDPEQALRHLEHAMCADPAALAAPLLAARLLAASGRSDQAEAMASSVCAREPQCAPAHALLADLHRNAGDIPGALECLRRALDANPWFSPAATQIGAILLEAGNAREAADMFTRALETADHVPVNHMGMAAALNMTGDTRGAAQRMLEALERDPAADAAAAFVLDAARAFFKQSQWREAARLLERVRVLRPGDMDAAFWLARALDHLGEPDRAAQIWERLAAQGGRYAAIAAQKLDARKPGGYSR